MKLRHNTPPGKKYIKIEESGANIHLRHFKILFKKNRHNSSIIHAYLPNIKYIHSTHTQEISH